jgi:trehalose synthase
MVHLEQQKISIDNYSPIIGEDKVENIKALAEKLKGKKICHVNSTNRGGGVAEILRRLVPLMRGVNLEVEWKVIEGSDEFFKVTKAMHNGLQGMDIPLTDQMKKTYLECNEYNAKQLKLQHDFVVMHDPQPAAIVMHKEKFGGTWIWRCHIDLSRPNPRFIDFLTPLIFQYDAQVFTMEKYVPKALQSKKTMLSPPSIDPLAPKNAPLPQDTITKTLENYGVDPKNPIITQVARFDPWKDPLGVIDVYRIIKKEFPKIQLLLVGEMAADDPEGKTYYEKTLRHAGDEQNIHLLTDEKGVGDIEVNAFQRASTIVLHKATRDGFGLSVSEALWKEVPVVGGNAGGITLQVINGKTGYLVNGIEDAAEKCLHLLKKPELRKTMGIEGKKHVLNNFLITRQLEDYLRLFNSVSL